MTDISNPVIDLLTVIPVTALTNADPSKMLRGVTTRHGFNLVNGDSGSLMHGALAELFEVVSDRDDAAFHAEPGSGKLASRVCAPTAVSASVGIVPE